MRHNKSVSQMHLRLHYDSNTSGPVVQKHVSLTQG